MVVARPTQGFVHTLSACWHRPALTLAEVAWRWAYGVPALLIVFFAGRRALLAATGGTLDPARLGLDSALLRDPVGALTADPMGASAKLAEAAATLVPQLWAARGWMLALLLGWIIVSSVGRTWVMRMADARTHLRVGTIMGLQTLRTAALLLIFGGWYAGVEACAHVAVTGPLAQNAEPNLVLFCAGVIVLSLALFTSWAAVSWVLSVAPLLAMLRNLGVAQSLRAALSLGPLKGKLVEINLVLGIVKIALVVLAMVFSATPLPFESVTSTAFLAWWWAGVTVLYLLWSDFFHVARLLGYLGLLQAYNAERSAAI